MGQGTLSHPFAPPQNVPDCLRAFPKPTIAAANGPAAGLGLAMICFCDYRIASERATFTSGLTGLGLAAELGLTYALPRLIGLPAALELLSNGETKAAVWAYNVGLVRQVTSPDQLMKASHVPASVLANMPPVALRMLKKLAYQSLESTYEEQIRTEAYAGIILAQTDDHKEAVRAYLEKRPPTFEGK
jgi:2-(1,2-epoxy-1,2-dihydrophenyl)acetyl-CoA isomerase